MRKHHVYVHTELHKDEKDGKYTVKRSESYPTGFDDSMDLILYEKLDIKNCQLTDVVDFELWNGERFGDRFGFDTSNQIGESFAEIWHLISGDEIDVYELYEKLEN